MWWNVRGEGVARPLPCLDVLVRLECVWTQTNVVDSENMDGQR